MKLISDGKPLYLATQEKKKFVLTQNWEFEHDLYSRFTFVVPSGYVSDLASVPLWIFWWQWGKWNIPAICHDYIYEYGYVLFKLKRGDATGKNPQYIKKRFDKRDADLLFYQIAIAVGVNPITAKLMYWACRLFGKGIWHQKDSR